MLVAANLGVAELVLARLGARPASRRLLAVALAAPRLALAYGYPRLRSIDAAAAAAAPVKVGIVQGNQPLIGRSDSLSLHVPARGSSATTASTWWSGARARAGMVNRVTPGYAEVRRIITNRLGVPTIMGGLLARARATLTYYNTALLSDEERRAILGRYDKEYLLAFGEYIPFGESSRRSTTTRRTPPASARAPRSIRSCSATTASPRSSATRTSSPASSTRWSSTRGPTCS